MVKSTLYYKMKGIKPDDTAAAKAATGPEKKGAGAGLKNILLESFSIVHMLCEMPAVMNMIFIASLLQCFIKFNLMKALVIFFAIGATVVWVVRVTVFILEKKMDREGPSL